MHPVLLRIPLPWGGTFRIATYGFMIMCGFLASLFIARRRCARLGMNPDALLDVALATLIVGVVGARLFYVFVEPQVFRSNWLEFFRIDHGGLIFYGGIIGGAAGLLASAAWKGLPLRRTLDVIMGVTPLGHAFGRVGCFMNGCCYGKVTESWVGVQFPRVVDPVTGQVTGSAAYLAQLEQAIIPASAEHSLSLYPTQLFAVGYNLLIFLFLAWMLKRRWRNGEIAWLWGILYGTARFCNEFYRGDVPRVAGDMTVAQWVCIPVVAIGFTAFLWSRRKPYEPLADPWQPLDDSQAARREEEDALDTRTKPKAGSGRRRRRR